MKKFYLLTIFLSIPYFSFTQCFYCEDFEGVSAPNLPNDMSTFSLESNYYASINGSLLQVDGFFTGTVDDAGAGGYWTYLEDHTTFAMTSDDNCFPGGVPANENNNCDLSYEVLELPDLNFTTASNPNLWLQFEYYHDKNWGGGDAIVEISTDGGNSYQNIAFLPDEQAWHCSI